MLLSELYGLNPRVYKPGDKPTRWDDLFGVELELENLSGIPEIPYWTIKNDGSLRNGYEYILREPLGGDLLSSALDEFYKQKLRYTNGPRTSTHIHITAGDLTLDNLRCMIVVLYTIEDALYAAIGESRKWGGYSMPIQEMATSRLRAILSSADKRALLAAISPNRNQERYYGFNMCVSRHGTVEFRYFPGGPTREELESWLDLVCAIKRTTKNTPLETLLNIVDSEAAMAGFLRNSLPAYWYRTLMGLTTSEQLFERFQEVAALCEVEAPQRREALVFATPLLLKFVCSRLIRSEAGKKSIQEIAKALPVMGAGDWAAHCRLAIAAQDDSPQQGQSAPRQRLPDALPDPYQQIRSRFGTWDDERGAAAGQDLNNYAEIMANPSRFYRAARPSPFRTR